MIDLNTLSPKTLVELFNLVSEKPTKKFESKAAGVKRLTTALEAAKSEVFEAGEGEYDVRPIANDDELTLLTMKGDENLIKEADLKPIPAEPAKVYADIPPAFKIAIANREAEIKANEEAKAAKPAKAKKSESAKSAGRTSPLLGQKLTLLRVANPKRPKSRTFVRYAVYAECKTSDDFVRICEERGLGTRREILSDLSWDSSQDFIKLGN